MALLTLAEEAAWRSRTVKYYGGDWDSVHNFLPEFDLMPFTAGPDQPANPFLQTVIRRPLATEEQPIPVGIVTRTYSLAPHRMVAELCNKGITDSGVEADELRYEVGLSTLGEWMNFRIYFPASHSIKDSYGHDLTLRLECFNSVDGWHRLMILFGWYRFICSNGFIIGETKIEINERHERGLDLKSIPQRIKPALKAVEADRLRIKTWQCEKISMGDIAVWANKDVSKAWGKKAAARVYHICVAGKDVNFDEPFAAGAATEKPVRYLDRVPGCPETAATKYDVSQAMSFVATHRNNTEERITWQTTIPHLLGRLATMKQ